MEASKIINDEPTEIWDDGTKIWRNPKGQVHRDNDLPAAIYADGCYQWYQNGLRHRDNDLPAIIWPDNFCDWYEHNVCIKYKEYTEAEAEEFKKPYYLQKPKKLIKFDRFEKLIQ